MFGSELNLFAPSIFFKAGVGARARTHTHTHTVIWSKCILFLLERLKNNLNASLVSGARFWFVIEGECSGVGIVLFDTSDWRFKDFFSVLNFKN